MPTLLRYLGSQVSEDSCRWRCESAPPAKGSGPRGNVISRGFWGGDCVWVRGSSSELSSRSTFLPWFREPQNLQLRQRLARLPPARMPGLPNQVPCLARGLPMLECQAPISSTAQAGEEGRSEGASSDPFHCHHLHLSEAPQAPGLSPVFLAMLLL